MEILSVFRADIGDYAYGGLNDGLEALHLSHFGYTRFEDGQFGLVIELPYAEWNTNL